MRFVLTGVYIERDGAGSAAGGVEELGGSTPSMRSHSTSVMVTSRRERVGWLARGRRKGEASRGELEGRIVTQDLGVVSVFVTGSELLDALAEQVKEGVEDAGRATGIVEGGGDGPGESQGAVESGQQQAIIGGEGPPEKST